jgi:FkbM family methyltransferase
MTRVTLPNGLPVEALNRFEALLVYREIVAEASYSRHGIAVPAGGSVFDVGANIGLYSIHLAQTVPGVRIRAFEPVARTFGMLQRNLAEHAPGVVAVNAGLSAAPGSAVIDVDRFSSVGASVTPATLSQASRQDGSLREWADAGLADYERIEPNAPMRMLRASLASRWAWPIGVTAVAGMLAFFEARKKLFLTRETCELRTLSGELAASGFAGLDLVKIDVEGAEEDVLRGIDEQDWPRIRQLVIEVHNADGRRDRLARDLERRGYRVMHDREDWALHNLMGISALFAIRVDGR